MVYVYFILNLSISTMIFNFKFVKSNWNFKTLKYIKELIFIFIIYYFLQKFIIYTTIKNILIIYREKQNNY